MSDLVVLVRIGMGWAGIWLMARGVPVDLAHLMTRDPATVDLMAQMLGEMIGGALALGQFLWWRLAKRCGWAT